MALPSQLQRSFHGISLDRQRVSRHLNGGFGMWIVDREACAQWMSNHDHLRPPPLLWPTRPKWFALVNVCCRRVAALLGVVSTIVISIGGHSEAPELLQPIRRMPLHCGGAHGLAYRHLTWPGRSRGDLDRQASAPLISIACQLRA